MPLPTPLPVPTAVRARRRAPSRVGALVVTAFALAGLAALPDRTTGLVLLLAATAVLGVAATLAMRAHWAAAAPVRPRPRPTTPSPAVPAAPDGDTVTAELRRLHEAHVEKVNLALDEGREDLARELADSYTDQALALLVRG